MLFNFCFSSEQVSASDPDCGVNAMVNYTLGVIDSGPMKQMEFEVRPTSGEICISGDLDFEKRNSYEFPVIATDRGEYFLFLVEIFHTSYLLFYFVVIYFWLGHYD